MSVGVSNPQAANDLSQAFQDKQDEEREDFEDLHQTRADLESTYTDGGTATELDTVESDVAETTESEGFAMTVDRRAGTTHIDTEYADDDGESREHRMKFGKPSGRATTHILRPVEAMEDDDAPLSELTDYIWPTLAHWCLAEDAPGVDVSPQDPDFWADNMGLGDAIGVLRSMAIGGNDLA